jgi:hypothetical protein
MKNLPVHIRNILLAEYAPYSRLTGQLKSLLLIIIIFAVLSGCRKDDATTGNNNTTGALLIKNPDVPADFGMKINLGTYGMPKLRGGHVFINNSSILITAASDIIQADFLSKTLTPVAPQSGGLITGLSRDHTYVLLIGNMNNQYGYFRYRIPSGPLERVLDLGKTEASHAILFDNTLLVYRGTPANATPCSGFCWGLPGGGDSNYTLYYSDKAAGIYRQLGSYYPLMFSSDGSRALLSGRNGYLYILNFQSQAITDSFPAMGYGEPLEWTDEPVGIAIEHSLTLPIVSTIVVKSLVTGAIKESYPTGDYISKVIPGPDGRILCGVGLCPDNSCKTSIWIVNRQAKTAGKVHEMKSGMYDFEDATVSPDGRKLVYRYINDLYLKEL